MRFPKRRYSETLSELLYAALFILPCLLGLVFFTYLPTLGSLGLSFSYWNLLGSPQWVGLANYQDVLTDPLFWQTAENTLVFVVFASLLEVGIALLLAVLLDRVIKGQAFFRTAYFLPFITPMVSVALVWGWIYEPEAGLLNLLLENSGVLTLFNHGQPVAWLYEPQTAMMAIIILRVWKNMGYNVILFLAGLQAINANLYDSAKLDGAGFQSLFWRITLPMLSPTLFFVAMVTVMNAFQAFDSIYLLTQGGPQHTTAVLVYWMFKQAFEFYRIGPASAIAYILFLIIFVLTLIQWHFRKRWVLYEND